MKQFRIYPYKMGSKGASLLAEGLRGAGARCFKVYPNKSYKPRAHQTIINWGNSKSPDWLSTYCNRFPMGQLNILNWPQYVANASNKLKAFQVMKDAGVNVPEFTTDPNVAIDWAEGGDIVVSRTKLHGHSGDGIVISEQHGQSNNGDYMVTVVSAPLYVKYIKKQDEYRVHVFDGQVIDIQMKRKKREVDNEEVDYQVRNHVNGWVYCRDGITPPESIYSDATSAVTSLGLDFGAVDIIYNRYKDTSYVLEVNCAPGLEGTTLTKYVEAFNNYN